MNTHAHAHTYSNNAQGWKVGKISSWYSWVQVTVAYRPKEKQTWACFGDFVNQRTWRSGTFLSGLNATSFAMDILL